MVKKNPIRVRFAPSPTGQPHIGSIWTALMNWLFARHYRGRFVLRIEDTDQKRFVPGSIEQIITALEWYGLTPDEGPTQGGNYGPYRQSQRLGLYQKYATQLVQLGAAYYCFCSPARLEKLRQDQTARKLPPKYDKHCATLTTDQVMTRQQAGERAVIRLKVPTTGQIEINDLVRGPVTFRFELQDDSVLLKTDGFPTYHLANVVDDHAMKISHVIRAEEWLPSVPKHLIIYKALGWTPPLFVHLPLLLGSDRSKLSKRHGATSALMFRDLGYVPAAMVNFLALMGWHPTGNQEILDINTIIKEFSLERINPAGAIFDPVKLDWLNGRYLRQLSLPILFKLIKPWWHIPPVDRWSVPKLKQALSLVQERIKKLSEINDYINFVFPSVWDSQVNSLSTTLLQPPGGTEVNLKDTLGWVKQWLNTRPNPWSTLTLRPALLAAIAASQRQNMAVLWPLRVVLTLQPQSPDVFDLLALLGPAETDRRLTTIMARLELD